ncbi:MAG TPA: hypothetical protein VGD99_04445 [Anaerolineae bacterium]
MATIEDLFKLRAEQILLNRKVMAVAAEVFPVGEIVTFLRNGKQITDAKVLEMSLYDTRFRIQNIRTKREYWVELSDLMQRPEVTNG